ncbi:hypothetical protein ACTI_62890 [Actinoplanes sp. OR16]|uniref:hypothetical protein n=1 Tax=Actinoplanes sp. OR16 TaxID=946334 RepID=UPI000F703BCB|nr:hypothetical protein [Actinoplanes sp. OR16]BBH69604.1 hypothetical protein ACTI_62890 [Actinoplanes sp. OR16]
MTDHWGDFDFDDHHEAPHEAPDVDHLDVPDLDHHDLGPELHDDLQVEDHHPGFEDPEPLAAPDVPELSETAGAEDLFPPALDLGELPEPVDGFPWIDTATLGAPDAAGFTPPLDPVTPDELAAYAHTGQPADWATLAESDDPATSALARWWTPDEQ